MFLKVLPIVSFISICIGEQAVKHAISSQSFHRGDVPLSYKYSAVHVYTTVKPVGKSGNAPYPVNYYKPPVDPMHFRSIQYAPLISPEEQRQSGLYTKISIPKENEFYQQISEATTAPKKDYLEPKLQATKNTEIYPHLLSHVQYIPGHNIEVLQNRNPGHNAVYRSYPGSGSLDKYNKGNHNQINHHTAYEKDKQNSQNVTAAVGSRHIAQVAPKLFHISDNKIYKYGDIIPQVGVPHEMYLQKPLTKMHALFLNVARTFNQAPVPHRGSLHSGASLGILENVPSHTQALIYAPEMLHSDSEPKTRLFPIQKNIHFAIHS